MATQCDEFHAKDLLKIEVDVNDPDVISSVRIVAISKGGEKLAFEMTFLHLEAVVGAAQRALAKYRAGIREH
ncbi:MAG: hypothetical protein JWL62_3866 [Hyphomicrobiales bacterium]|nr:hypothetical protein [Hyphomicrobiales bacterium]